MHPGPFGRRSQRHSLAASNRDSGPPIFPRDSVSAERKNLAEQTPFVAGLDMPVFLPTININIWKPAVLFLAPARRVPAGSWPESPSHPPSSDRARGGRSAQLGTLRSLSPAAARWRNCPGARMRPSGADSDENERSIRRKVNTSERSDAAGFRMRYRRHLRQVDPCTRGGSVIIISSFLPCCPLRTVRGMRLAADLLPVPNSGRHGPVRGRMGWLRPDGRLEVR